MEVTMESVTTIRRMMAGNTVIVPKYQRAYSWDEKQRAQFVKDLDDYISSCSQTPYYFGHFLFENTSTSGVFNIIDGQQRLTTIEIFLCAVFSRLSNLRELSDTELEIKEDIIKRNSTYRFKTVEYDNPFFKDYVIDQTKLNKDGIETQSAKRLAMAFDSFSKSLEEVNAQGLEKYIETIANSACTTHVVGNEAEAIQMFIFQNDRGKAPTKLEVIKAHFMYEVHISSAENDEKSALLKELQERFEHIYKAISTIEANINEDDVLLYALRVYFNTLDIDTSTERIEKELKNKTNALLFIKGFTQELETCFECLKLFFCENDVYEIYSLALLGKNSLMPFVIKAYKYNIPTTDKAKLCSALESLILRHRIIGTRAHLEDRVKVVYKNFKKNKANVGEIVSHIRWMEKEVQSDWTWWQYWSDENFDSVLQGYLDPKIAKHLLWKYENYLLSQEKQGYKFMPYSQIEKPELEHIAPQTPTDETPVAAGYCDYDDDFKNAYLDCLGNYLLISKSHNGSIGNVSFSEKRDSYTVLEQQREIQHMTEEKKHWTKEEIDNRHTKLVDFVMNL